MEPGQRGAARLAVRAAAAKRAREFRSPLERWCFGERYQ